MDQQWIVPAWALLAFGTALLLLVVWLVVALARSRSRTTAALERAHADAEALKAQVEEIQCRLERPAPTLDEHEYVITHLGDAPDAGADESAPTVAGPLFADLVLREGIVQAASLAVGLRRALAPEMRNRIRFEMKRELRRARKQRKADLRQARREHEARRRGGLESDDLAEGRGNAA